MFSKKTNEKTQTVTVKTEYFGCVLLVRENFPGISSSQEGEKIFVIA